MHIRFTLMLASAAVILAVACGGGGKATSSAANSAPNAKVADNADLCRDLLAWRDKTIPAFATAMESLGDNPSPAEVKKALPPAWEAFLKPLRDMEKRAPRDLQLELQDALKASDAYMALVKKSNYDLSKIDKAEEAKLDAAFPSDSGGAIATWRAKNCLR